MGVLHGAGARVINVCVCLNDVRLLIFSDVYVNLRDVHQLM